MFLKLIIISIIINATHADKCRHLLNNLAVSQMNFTRCITLSSVPVTMCINCSINYSNAAKYYNLLEEHCSDLYFNKDRINLVASMQLVLTGLWSKAYCDDCYNNNNSNIFYEKNSTLMRCLQLSGNDPCNKCKAEYMDLNNFYINLDQHNNGEVCYDLQDQMNRTRDQWSKKWKCCQREENMTLFLIALCATSCLPLLFYGTTFLVTKRQEQQYQRLLYNEDTILNPELATTSRRNNINDINNPTQSMVSNETSSMPKKYSSLSSIDRNLDFAATTIKPALKSGFYSDESLESSDDEILVPQLNPEKNKKL